MRRAHKRRSGGAAMTAVVVSLATFAWSPATAAPGAHPAKSTDRPAPGSRSDALAKKLGLQTVPKQAAMPKERRGAAKANPLLSLVPDPSLTDLHYWNSKIETVSKRRTKAVTERRSATVGPLLVEEAEPDTVRGGNDVLANGQFIPKFGATSNRRSTARLLGTLAPSADPIPFPAVPEDNGSISLAGETGLVTNSMRHTTGTIGDGPHGSGGDATGDFDYYAIHGATAGQHLTI